MLFLVLCLFTLLNINKNKYQLEFITVINMAEGTQYRPMKYPYTILGKLSQFPYRYYIQHSWLFKFTLIGGLLSLPIFYKIQKLCKYILYRSAIVQMEYIHIICYHYFQHILPRMSRNGIKFTEKCLRALVIIKVEIQLLENYTLR